MTNITYLSISSKTKHFVKDGQDINCRPNQAKKPCVPQDEFESIEKCMVCGKTF